MPNVHVPGVGVVAFPDEMGHDEIVKAIEAEILPPIQAKNEAARIQALPPVKEPSMLDTLSHPLQNVKDFYGIKGGQNEDSWGEIAKRIPQTVGYEGLAATGGLVRAAGESLASVGEGAKSDKYEPVFGRPASPLPPPPHPLPSPVDALRMIGEKTAALGKDAADYWRTLAEQSQPRVEDGTVKYYVSGAAKSIGNNLVHLVAGVMARNPNVALWGMGIQAGASQYNKLREKDIDHTKATLAALGYTGAEIGGEMLPVGVLFDPKLGFLKRVALETASDIPGELATQVVESGIDKGTVDPNMTWGEFKKQLRDTLVITAISSPILGAGAHAAHKVIGGGTQERVEPPVPPAPSAEPATPAGLQEAPPQPVPPVVAMPSAQEQTPLTVPLDRRNAADLPPIQPDGTTRPMSAEEVSARGAPVEAQPQESAAAQVPIPENDAATFKPFNHPKGAQEFSAAEHQGLHDTYSKAATPFYTPAIRSEDVFPNADRYEVNKHGFNEPIYNGTPEEVSRKKAADIAHAENLSASFPPTVDINTPERNALRETIVDYLYGKGAKNKNRKVDIVFGLSASGKSGVAEDLASEHGSLVIDSDQAKELLPEFRGGIGANAVHQESSHIIDKKGGVLRKALEVGDNVVLPLVGKNYDRIKTIANGFKEAGYDVTIHWVNLPVEKTVARSMGRFFSRGRLVPEGVIRGYGLQPRQTFDRIKSERKVNGYREISTDVPLGEQYKILESGRFDNAAITDNQPSDGPGRRDGGGIGDVLGGFREGAAGKESDASQQVVPPANSYESTTDRATIGARQGRVDTLEIPGEKPVRIQYAVVEAKDIQPSHNAETFSKNPGYPDGIQERRYHADDAESGKVIDGARNLKPQYVLTDNPDGANGPPVILANGLVMGGNGRSMMIKRNYSSGGTAYKSALEEAAPRFGIDVAKAKGMDQPVLVRILAETPTTRDAARELVSNLNRTATQALEPTAAAVSAGERVSAKSQEWLAGKLDDLGEEATITKLIASPNQAGELFRRLMADGVISKQDQRKYYNPDTSKFTDQGKLFIENAIMGNVINDAELLDGMTPSIRQKLARALAPLARMKASNKEWNLVPTIKKSIELINEAHAEGERTAAYLKTLEKQVSMFSAPREIPSTVKSLAKFLDESTQTEIKRAFTRWADEATRGSSNQGELLGMVEPQKTPADLIKELFVKARQTLKSLENATNRALDDNLPLAQLEAPMGMAASVVDDTVKGAGVSFPDPQVEARFKMSKGLSQVGIFNKLRAYMEHIKRDFTRTWEHIPRGEGRFAQFSFDLTTLAKQGEVAKARTVKIFQGYFHKFGPKKFDLFTRAVFLNDLGFEVRRGHALPWGFTPETWADAKAKIDKIVEANPDIKEAVEKRRQVWDALKAEYTAAMSAIGIDVSERFKNPDYIHHEVLKYAELEADKRDKAKGGTKAPTGRGFMKKREGSSLDINSNFLEAEAKVMAQMMYDVEIAKFIAKTREDHDIAGALRAEAKKRNEAAIAGDAALAAQIDGLKGTQRKAKIKELLGDKAVTWKSLIPEDYEIWQPRDGNVLFWAYSMPDQLVDNAIEGMVPVKGIHEALVQGGPRTEYALPKEIAATLNEFHKDKPHFVSEASAYIQRHWKILMLISPGRVIKYNIRNEIGDLDHVLAGAPGALKHYGRAIKELYSSMISERGITPDLQDWMNRGGPWSTLQYQEMADINKIKALANILEKPSNRPDKVIARWFKEYWGAARKWTDFRESSLRYAAYLHFLEGIKKTGKVENYAASLRAEIDALKYPKDKAFKLSNELMGSYDTVSVAGRQIRRHLFPFWSFQETNMQTYKRLVQNARIDGGNAGTILRVAGVKLTGATMKGTILAARAYIGAFALIAITQAWNLGMYPDDEEELDQFNRNRPHLLLGRDADGTIRYFSGLGSLGDAFAWVGLDSVPGQINDWVEGRRSLVDVFEEMAKSPVNKLAQGISPILKTPAELAARKQLFPDVFHPTPIKDRRQYIARMLVFDNLYKELAGMPNRGLPDGVKDLFYYRIAPNQGAYNDIQGLKEDFLAKKGIERENWVNSSKSRAAYFYKLAIRLGDKEAAAKWLGKYAEDGGTPQGINDTIKGMQPLGGLSRREVSEFYEFLGSEGSVGRRKLSKAYNYYYDVLLGKKE